MTQTVSLILQESNEKGMVKFIRANFDILSYLFIATILGAVLRSMYGTDMNSAPEIEKPYVSKISCKPWTPRKLTFFYQMHKTDYVIQRK